MSFCSSCGTEFESSRICEVLSIPDHEYFCQDQEEDIAYFRASLRKSLGLDTVPKRSAMDASLDAIYEPGTWTVRKTPVIKVRFAQPDHEDNEGVL
jgi:hypothetical protein